MNDHPDEAVWLVDALAAEPTVQSGLFRVESTELIESKGFHIGEAVLRFVYLDIQGKPKEAQARLLLRRDMVESAQKIPLAFFAHYELLQPDCVPVCEKGWAVLTPHSNAELFMGNSDNLNLALLEWARRLPFVDRAHLLIEGASAGGYMTLTMASELFPVAAAVVDVPAVNLCYNIAYLAKNERLGLGAVTSTGDPLDFKDAPIPIFGAFTGGIPLATELYGDDFSSPAYRNLSPIRHLDRITCPVSLAASTADVLAPMPQISQRHFVPPDAGTFPEGFEMRLDALVSVPEMRRPLLDVLPEEKRTLYVHKISENTPDLDPMAVLTVTEGEAPGQPFDRPYDERKQWSIVILDEGPPTPRSAHYRYHYKHTTDSFKAHYQKAPLSREQLTLVKLQRLMERFTDKLSDLPVLRSDDGTGKPAHRLNFASLEQLDVVTGLLDYADQGPEFERRLQGLYEQLQEELKPWGPALEMSHLRNLARELRAAVAQVTGAA